MAILNQLGINYTTFYCFFIFIVTFFFLKEILFRPYYLAFEEREKRTKGGETSAKDLQAKTAQLKAEFEGAARDLNSQIKATFDQSRTQASKETEAIITAAKAQAEKVIEDTRSHVAKELKKAQDQLSLETPGVALAITKKMLD
ncbi:MAG: synthase chain [Pseudomonadota bacterium]|jgi:F-type H+-transporting ATPase subunit b